MKKLFAIALLASFTTLAAPLQWTCDWPEAKSQTFSLYQGETATFEPTFRVNGLTVTNATIEAVWYQTNGMGNAWWKLDGATFAPSNDVGAAAYRFFVEAKTSDDILYRANGALRMLPSPGFTPNAIEPPIVTLDFANIEVLNPPWTEIGERATGNGERIGVLETNVYTKAETESKIVELAPAPGNYAAVSNAAVYAAITNAIQDTAIAGKASKSDATLTERGYSEWSIVHTLLSDEAKEMFFDESADAAVNDYAVTIRGNSLYVGDYDVASLLLSSDGLRYAFSVGSPAAFTIWGPNGTTVATRELLSGCILGPNDPSNPNCDKPLASEAEAEALRNGKQDKLPYPTNAIPYAAISGKPSLATVATSGSYNDLSNKPTIPTVPTNVSSFNNDAGYLTSYTESDPTIKSWAKAETKPTYTASEVGATTAADVYRIVAGTNVVLVVTNYNSATHAAAMKLQHLDPETGQYVTYWDEMRQHGITYTNGMNYTDAAIAERAAPRAWSGTTSGLGSEAPAGVTWISTPETVIAGGFEYEKVVTSAGAVWVLTSNGMSTGATSNSFFRVAASDGTELFSIEKTDSYLIGVNADGITRSGNTVTIPINVVGAEHPYIRCTKNLVNPTWVKEDEGGLDCDWATVSWSGTTGAYVATVTTAEPQAFFYFEYMVGGQVKIKNSAKTEMSGGILFNGTTYLPTVNGNKLEFVAQ